MSLALKISACLVCLYKEYRQVTSCLGSSQREINIFSSSSPFLNVSKLWSAIEYLLDLVGLNAVLYRQFVDNMP